MAMGSARPRRDHASTKEEGGWQPTRRSIISRPFTHELVTAQ